MSLYLKHRPTTFAGVVGQQEAVKILQGKLPDLPHTVLLSGPTGTGKTTLARILAKELGCEGYNLCELNCADVRGIDTVRDINEVMHLAPMGGKCRVWILDECFHGNTMINTPSGMKRIDSIKEGESVYNISGTGTVSKVFLNQVPIHRVIRLAFDDGTVIFTSKDHLFLTDSGWKKAEDLNNCSCILSNFCHPHNHENSHPDLCVLSSELSVKVPGQVAAQVLLKKVCNCFERKEQRTWTGRNKEVYPLRCGVPNSYLQVEKIVQPVLFLQAQTVYPRNEREKLYSRIKKENQSENDCILQLGGRKETEREGLTTSSRLHSSTGVDQEDERDKTQEGDVQRLLRNQGWKWAVHQGTIEAIRGSWPNMGVGTSYPHGNEVSLPNQLQTGYSVSRAQDSNRSRWEEASTEEGYLARCKEDGTTRKVRLVSSEIYQQGSNDQSFLGVIGDRENGTGLVTFFDLEVTGNHSYFVQGLPVHNCTQLPKTTQQAFLKILEDTPKHVWFLLCSSETSGLLPTFLGRCFHLILSSLTGNELYTIMYKCLEKEALLKGLSPTPFMKDFPRKVLDAIVPLANGSGRSALQLLEATLTQTNEPDMLKALGVAGQEQEERGEFLAHALFRRATWREITPLIKDVEDKDLESLRRQVLKYAEKCLLGNGGKQAYLMIQCFRDGWGWCGKAGLVAACWECTKPGG